MSTTVNDVNNSSTSSSSSSSSITANGQSDMSQMFTQLLVAQIKNQDPLSPQDPSAMVTQLTQMSQMESLQTLAKQGTTQSSMLSSLQTLTLGNQVGQKVRAEISSAQLGDNPLQLRFNLASNTEGVNLVLTNELGQKTTVPLGALSAGSQGYVLDRKALGLPAGSYGVALDNSNKEQTPVEAEAVVSSVMVGGGSGAILNLAGVGLVDSTGITEFLGRP